MDDLVQYRTRGAGPDRTNVLAREATGADVDAGIAGTVGDFLVWPPHAIAGVEVVRPAWWLRADFLAAYEPGEHAPDDRGTVSDFAAWDTLLAHKIVQLDTELLELEGHVAVINDRLPGGPNFRPDNYAQGGAVEGRLAKVESDVRGVVDAFGLLGVTIEDGRVTSKLADLRVKTDAPTIADAGDAAPAHSPSA
jgi:hypothetical protein